MTPDAHAIANPSAVEAAAATSSIAVICGGGSFPAAVADSIARRGRRPVMMAIENWADRKVVEGHAHHWVALGQLGRLIRLAQSEGCREAVFIGTLLRPPLTKIRLDWQTIRAMPRLLDAFRGGDDRLLKGVARVIEEGGLRIIGLDEVAPEILVPEGVLGRHQPTARDHADIARALEAIRALGAFDVGQGAIVANGHVLALEAAEGTDNMLARVAELRRQRRVTTPLGVGVLVKAPKPGQDRRFDLPAIGLQTIENIAGAGLAGLAVAAGGTIIADALKTIAAADRARIFLLGVREGAAP
jgi:UDP-2,3-diacylglucosamine hydrolase